MRRIRSLFNSNNTLQPFSTRRFLPRLLLFSLVWFILAGNEASSWLLGAPAVLGATIVSLMLADPHHSFRLRLVGVFYFLPFFIAQSIHSGIDVMRRALSASLPINPGIIHYSSFLPKGPALILFVNAISLLPGTLSADLNDQELVIHTLDRNLGNWSNLQNLEGRIAALFGVTSHGEEPQ